MRPPFTKSPKLPPRSTTCWQSVHNGPVTREHHRIAVEKLQEVTTRIANLQRRVPRDADAGAFLKEVTQIAKSDQLAIKDFHPEKPEVEDRLCGDASHFEGAGEFR